MTSRHSWLATAAAPALLLFALGAPAAVSAAPVMLQQGTATCSQHESGPFLVDEAIDGVVNTTDGWAVACVGNEAVAETAVFETAADITGPSLLTFTFEQRYGGVHTLGRFRLSATTADRADFADGLDDGGDLGLPEIWTVLDPAAATSTGGATLTEQGDNSILASGTSPDVATYRVAVPTALSPITGIRLELMEDASLPFSGPGRQPTNGNLVLTELSLDALACTAGQLDIDDDDALEPLTDALLILRYLFQFRDGALVNATVGQSCERCLADDIEDYIAGILSKLDIDDDGAREPLTDGLLLLRYAFGFRDSALISGAVGVGCKRCLAAEIETYLACLLA